MTLPYKKLILCFLFLTPLFSMGQQPVFRHYSVDDGLPSSEIYHVIQDSKGYIWMATNIGVSRFDGKTFKNFDAQDGLPENTVFEVYEDEVGRLWFISFPFQLSYYSNDTIHPYKYNDILLDIAGNGLIPVKKSFQVNKDNNLIFSFLNNDKIYEIDKAGQLHIKRKIENDSTSILISEINNQLFAAHSGIRNIDLVLSLEIKKREYSITIDKSFTKYSFGYFMMQLTSSGKIIFANNELLTIIDPNGGYETFNLKDKILWISAEQDGSIWIGKDLEGAEKYDIKNIKKGPVEKYLKGTSVSSIFVDNENGIWISSLSTGLYYLPSNAFVSYTKKDGLSGNNIKTIEIFKDAIYLGSDSYALDVIQNNRVKIIEDFGNSNNAVKVLNSSDGNTLWIGTDLFLHSYDGNKFTKYTNNYKLEGSPQGWIRQAFSIKDILPTKSNEVILGQMRSLAILKNKKVFYDSYLDDNLALRIESIERETDSSFLVGTFNGLWRLVGTKLKYLGEESVLLKKRITDIAVFQSGKGFVLATKGSGLVIKINDSIIQLTQDNGLSSNSITSLLVNKDVLWIATNNGLNLLNIKELGKNQPHIVVFKKEHGLISNEVNQIKGDENFIYIATNGGLTVFDRSKYQQLKYPPPVYINGVRIMNLDTIISSSYSLSHLQNFISISYSGISFRDAGNLKYKYRLVGLSNKWISTSNLQVEYAFLPPGKYKFEVYAINSEGLMSSHPAILNFIISPPFWKTWWFILISAIIVIGLLVTYISFSMRRVKREHNLQGDINKYRQQALIRQMDPHFVFNTLNSIQSFIIKNDNLSSALYLAKFAKLMRLILNNSQKQKVALNDEIDALNLYMQLESMRFNHKFEFSIKHDPSIEADLCYIPAFIVQPFVENAIWHGIMNLDRPGLIKIDFQADGNNLICSIEDNGIGRVRSKEFNTDINKKKQSLGISIVETRLNLLSNYYGVPLKMNFLDLYSAENKAIGTRVTINLPIIN